MNYRSSVFKRYLISAFSLLLLPGIILIMFILNIYISKYYEEVDEGIDHYLFSVQQQLDIQLSQMYNIVYQMNKSPEATIFLDEPPMLASLMLMPKLESYTNIQQFFNDIAFYPVNSSLLCFSSTTSDINRFYDKHTFSNWKPQEIYNDLNRSKKVTWRSCISDADNTRNIAGIFPSDFDNTSMAKYPHRFSCLFLISESTLKRFVKVEDLPEGCSLLILDASGEVIYSSEPTSSKAISGSSLISNKTSGFAKEKFLVNGKDHSLRYISSDIKWNSPWTYVMLVDEKAAFSGPSAIRVTFILLTFLVLGFLAFIAYIVAKWNYRPIAKLNELACRTADLTDDSSSKNEFTNVSNIITNLVSSRAETIQKASGHIRDSLLSKLLKGSFSDLDKFNKEAGSIGIQFTSDFFQIIYLYIDRSTNPNSVEEAIKTFEEAFMDYFAVVSTRSVEHDGVIFILSFKETQDERIKSLLHLIQTDLDTLIGTNYAFYVGRPYSGIENIRTSYLEACVLLHYRYPNSHRNIMFYGDTELYSEYTVYPNKEVELVGNALISGDLEKADLLLKDIANIVKTQQLSWMMKICLYYDLCHCILNNIPECHPDFRHEVEELIKYLTSNPSAQNINLSDMILHLQELLQQFFAGEESHLNKSTLINRVVRYVQKHYTDPNFSIQQVSDEMGLSAANLSQQFKYHTGQNISDYIAQLRMEKAKELLRTTEYSVNEIAVMVGYISSTSFISKFKQLTEKTPGLYRKLYSSPPQ